MFEITLMKYVNLIISGLLLSWGVLIKLDTYSEIEAKRLYRKWEDRKNV